MGKLNDSWKLSVRDGERHSLNWSKNNPEKAQKEKEMIKQEILKLNETSKDEINLKEKYPTLFNE